MRVYESQVRTASQAVLMVEDRMIKDEVEIALEYGKGGRMAVYLERSQVEELVTQLSEILEKR